MKGENVRADLAWKPNRGKVACNVLALLTHSSFVTNTSAGPGVVIGATTADVL